MATALRKTALVTGGNRGIGFAICQGLLAKGFEVILAARSPEKGKAAISKLSTTTDNALSFLQLDIADDRSIEQAASQLIQTIGQLDVLINNAGIYLDQGKTLLHTSRERLSNTMHTNTFGPLRLVQAVLPLLENAENARIINVSSGNGQLQGLDARVPSYSLSKLALNGVTILMAEELHRKGIAVYAICPGWVRTDMGGADAPRSPEKGAETAVWLATNGTLKQSGLFFRDCQPQPY